MSALLAGVDVSTAGLAFVTLDLETGDLVAYGFHAMPTLKALGHNRALRCSAPALDLLAGSLESASVVAVEQPMGAQVKAIAEVERVVGAVLHAIGPGAERWLIGPSEWKRLVGCGPRPKGTPKGQKPEVDAVALAHFPSLADQPQDVRDAACIALAGVELHRKAMT